MSGLAAVICMLVIVAAFLTILIGGACIMRAGDLGAENTALPPEAAKPQADDLAIR